MIRLTIALLMLTAMIVVGSGIIDDDAKEQRNCVPWRIT